MKIAYILYPEAVISNQSNGVRSQALTWVEILKNRGHQVDIINIWGIYDWTTYDSIHFFAGGAWLNQLVIRLSKINPNLILSPIVDPPLNVNYLLNDIKFYSAKIMKAPFLSSAYRNTQIYNYFKAISIRSDFEGTFLSRFNKISTGKLIKVPLSYNKILDGISWSVEQKKDFCLHISSITQKRKNVIRLIEAAKKYNFKLVLAGNKGTDSQFEPIKRAIGNSDNITVLGFISEEQKIELYRTAKVFALPSIEEGVGIVAVEAAVLGCEIAITNIPGPKEYYKGNCVEVDPFDVDSIGLGITSLLSGTKKFQPFLSKFVRKEYSYDNISILLENLYKNND